VSAQDEDGAGDVLDRDDLTNWGDRAPGRTRHQSYQDGCDIPCSGAA
jgi:hypothetical protein